MSTFPYIRFQSNRTLEEAKEIYEQRVRDARNFFERYSSTFVSRPCPVCGEKKVREMEKFLGLYGVSCCLACATQYVNPVPPQVALNEYYQAGSSTELTNKNSFSRNTKPSEPFLDVRVQKVVAALKSKKSSEKLRVLEIGCNSGGFLAKLYSALEEVGLSGGVELSGIDVDQRAIQNPVSAKIELIHANASNFLSDHEGSFDAILFFELIEHLPEPFQFLQAVKKALKTGGTAIMTTPNANGLELLALGYNQFRPLAHAIFPPMHLNAFSTENVTPFSLRAGLGVVEISTPGRLDVDIVTTSKEHVRESGFQALAECDESTRGLIQHLVAKLKASSHMLVELVRLD